MRRTLLLLAAGSAICFGSIPPPYFAECRLVDEMVAKAKGNSASQGVVLEILERIVERQIQSARLDLELAAGLPCGQFRKPEFSTDEVRIEALLRISDLDMPEALDYLKKLSKDRIAPVSSGQVWDSAEIALHRAELNRISDENARIGFLEETTGDKSAAAERWAVQSLCNQGSKRSLPFIRESVRRRNPTADGEEQIRFCEARMAIISRSPDRTKALASLLVVTNGVTDQELLGWAVNELRDIDSPQADAEIQRYAKEIEQLPNGPLKTALSGKRAQIRDLLPHPPK